MRRIKNLLRVLFFGRNFRDPEIDGLVREIISRDAEKGRSLLSQLAIGLRENHRDVTYYQAAEALVMGVYPKYKFSEFGRLYLEDADFIEFYKRFMDVDNWHSLDRKYALDQLLKLVGHLEGDIVECGCYKGASAYLMCRALAASTGVVHLFDSFEGLSEPGEYDGEYWTRGALAANEDTVRETLSEFDNYRLYKGWIPDKFPDSGDHNVRFLHVDVDLYEPTIESLRYFYPRLERGGVILMDDYGFTTCPGAKQAADEYFSDKPESIVSLPTGQGLVIKI